jgi:hypothetical protein
MESEPVAAAASEERLPHDAALTFLRRPLGYALPMRALMIRGRTTLVGERSEPRQRLGAIQLALYQEGASRETGGNRPDVESKPPSLHEARRFNFYGMGRQS